MTVMPTGMIKLFAGNFATAGYVLTAGEPLPTEDNKELYRILGNRFGAAPPDAFLLPKIPNVDKHVRYEISTGDNQGSGGPPGFPGAIMLWPSPIPPDGWAVCDGSTLQIDKNEELYAAIGTTFGGDKALGAFNVPDISPFKAGDGDEAIITYIIARIRTDSEPGLCDVVHSAAPLKFDGADMWKLCNGMELQVYEHSAVFSLLGTTYGGNGRTYFNLPTLPDLVSGVRALICTDGEFPSRD